MYSIFVFFYLTLNIFFSTTFLYSVLQNDSVIQFLPQLSAM